MPITAHHGGNAGINAGPITSRGEAMKPENAMSSSGRPPAPVTEALRAGELTGAWTLDTSRSLIRLRTSVLWGLVPVTGVFRQVSGEGVVGPAGEAHGTVRVTA